ALSDKLGSGGRELVERTLPRGARCLLAGFLIEGWNLVLEETVGVVAVAFQRRGVELGEILADTALAAEAVGAEGDVARVIAADRRAPVTIDRRVPCAVEV